MDDLSEAMADERARMVAVLVVAQQDVEECAERLDKARADRSRAMGALHDEGWSLQRIGDRIGVSKQAVAKAVERTRVS